MTTISSPPSAPGATFRWGAALLTVLAVEVLDRLDAFQVRRVPGAERFFDGLVSWRGQFLPVVNPGKRLNLPELPAEAPVRLVILSFVPSPLEEPEQIERFAIRVSRLDEESDGPAISVSPHELLGLAPLPVSPARNSAC